MPRPDNRIAHTLPGRDPFYDISDRKRAITMDKKNLAEIEKLAHVNRRPDGPGQRRYKVASEAASMLGLDQGRRTVAERMIQQVVDDARDLFGIAKEGLAHGFSQHMVKAMLEAGMQIREDNALNKSGGPYTGPRGGKWADAEMTIPWKESRDTGNAKRDENRTKAKNATRAKAAAMKRTAKDGEPVKVSAGKRKPGFKIPKPPDQDPKAATKKSGSPKPPKAAKGAKPFKPGLPAKPSKAAKPAKPGKVTPAKGEGKKAPPFGGKGAAAKAGKDAPPKKGPSAKPPFGTKGPPSKGTELPGRDKPPLVQNVPVPQADQAERDIGKRLKPGAAHEEIAGRFDKIKKLAKQHNVSVTGSVNANHSHAHMDELEKRVGLKVASRFGVQPKDVQHNAAVSPSMTAAHASQLPPHGAAPGALPGQGSPQGPPGQQGGPVPPPGGSAQPGAGSAVPPGVPGPGGANPPPGMAPAGGAPPGAAPMNAPPVNPPSHGGAPPAGPAAGQPPGHPHPSNVPAPPMPPPGAAPPGAPGAEPPPGGAPPGAPGADAGGDLPPDVNESTPHGAKMIGEAVDTVMDKLKQVSSRATQPHQKQMLAELKKDAASIKKAPSRSAFKWLASRISSFVGLIGGAAIGGMLAGPGGAVTGAMLGRQMVKSEPQFLINKKSGRLLMKAEGDRGGHVVGHTASGQAIYEGKAPPIHNRNPPRSLPKFDEHGDPVTTTAVTKVHEPPSSEPAGDEHTEKTPSGQRPTVKLPTYKDQDAFHKAHGGMSATWHKNTAAWHGKEREKAATQAHATTEGPRRTAFDNRREYHQRMQNAHALEAQAKTTGQSPSPRAAQLAVEASGYAQHAQAPMMAKSMLGFPIEQDEMVKADVLSPLRALMKPHQVIVASDSGEQFTLRGDLSKAGIPECFLDHDGARSATLGYDSALDLYRHLSAKGEA